MTLPQVSLLPSMTGANLPTPTVEGLSDDEQRLITGLANKLTFQSPGMKLHNLYYEGNQVLQNLGISIPPQLAGLRTVVDWPRVCIDPLVQRAVVDGFRLPGATDVDSEMQEHWAANDLDSESQICFLDALVYGRGYMIVGSPDSPGDSPLVTVESPLNLTTTWDPRTRSITAAYQSYEVEGEFRAVLYLPNETISMSRNQSNAWAIEDRDQHNFGEVPVVRFINRERSADREGRSEITPAVMNTTDSTCRSLLGMEIAREVYSIPHLYVLGASESDFVGSDGQPKTALQMAMTKILAFERDEDGEIPTVGQFKAFDPSVFTKIIDSHAQRMSAFTGFPPSYFGLTATANPASADAIRVSLDGLNRRSGAVNGQFSNPLGRMQRLVWRFANNGAPAPDDVRRVQTEWADPMVQTPAATADALTKYAGEAMIPPRSDVVLKRAGFNSVERAQLAQDFKADEAAQILRELASSVQAKDARTDLTVAADIAKPSDSATVAS